MGFQDADIAAADGEVPQQTGAGDDADVDERAPSVVPDRAIDLRARPGHVEAHAGTPQYGNDIDPSALTAHV
jgi:hypothetical protein